MVSFISCFASIEMDPAANDIEVADRYLLYPNFSALFETKILSGYEMLIQHLLEINPSIDHTQTLRHLVPCFYGDVLVAHTANHDLDMLYSNSLDLFLGNV